MQYRQGCTTRRHRRRCHTELLRAGNVFGVSVRSGNGAFGSGALRVERASFRATYLGLHRPGKRRRNPCRSRLRSSWSPLHTETSWRRQAGLGGRVQAITGANAVGVFLTLAWKATRGEHEDQKRKTELRVWSFPFLSLLMKTSNPTARMPMFIRARFGGNNAFVFICSAVEHSWVWSFQ